MASFTPFKYPFTNFLLGDQCSNLPSAATTTCEQLGKSYVSLVVNHQHDSKNYSRVNYEWSPRLYNF